MYIASAVVIPQELMMFAKDLQPYRCSKGTFEVSSNICPSLLLVPCFGFHGLRVCALDAFRCSTETMNELNRIIAESSALVGDTPIHTPRELDRGSSTSVPVKVGRGQSYSSSRADVLAAILLAFSSG